MFQSLGNIGLLGKADNETAAVLASNGDTYYSGLSDFFFQVVFVATAMSIVSGAVAERMKLWAFFTFAVVLTGFIYPVQGFWKWGGGWLNAGGFADFAGSGVVHMCGAAAALAGVLLLGPRKGKYGPKGQVNAIPGCNLPLAALGTLVLWMGWFGFNGGSQLAVSNVENSNAVALIFVNTNMAAAGGLVAALLLARTWFGKADLTMALNGALAGLVAITAEPLTPAPGIATLIGAVGGLLVVFSIVMLDKLQIDDPSVRFRCMVWSASGACWRSASQIPMPHCSGNCTASVQFHLGIHDQPAGLVCAQIDIGHPGCRRGRVRRRRSARVWPGGIPGVHLCGVSTLL